MPEQRPKLDDRKDEPDATMAPEAAADIDEDRLVREQALAVLRRAGDLIHDQCAWTKNAVARDIHSLPVHAADGRATRFCASGAILHAAHELLYVEPTGESDELPVDPSVVPTPPVMQAYWLLGEAMMIVYDRPGVRARLEEEPAALSQLATFRGVALGGKPISVSSWQRVVEDLNDQRRTQHRHVVDAFWLAPQLAELLDKGELSPRPNPD